MHCGTTGSCQSAATSKIVKRCWSRVHSCKWCYSKCPDLYLLPLPAPVTITQYVARMERQFNACQTPCSMYLSIFNSFRIIRCLSQCVSPKIAIFTIFVTPGDAPGAITLNIVWMEREFDAYKLSRCMCPSNYNHFWNRARYSWKIVILSYPLAFNAPVTGVPVGILPSRLVREN